MSPSKQKEVERIYPVCRSIMGPEAWSRFQEREAGSLKPASFPERLALSLTELAIPAFLPELARLEWRLHKLALPDLGFPGEVDQLAVNPSLRLLGLSWKNLPALFSPQGDRPASAPEPGEELVAIWRDPQRGGAEIQTASKEDLLALKIVAEGIGPEEAAASGKVSVDAIDSAMDRAVLKGILLRPKSRLRRDPTSFPWGKGRKEEFLTASTFTLQWHITQSCDLCCKHCYDRSPRPPVPLDQGMAILDKVRAFSRSRQVRGQVSFTGGNPFLHPDFFLLYRAAGERGLDTAILGNPVPREKIREALAIRRPAFFQVSLEGLPEHNDSIRGRGHFERVMDFLELLRELGIYSMVMLTLTADNLHQVLPLAERLRNRADSFTFNRLSQVGEGANLRLPPAEVYASFLESYLEAERHNPILALKDNLLNILLHRKGAELFGGCTGHGCGAAFNFLAVLPDGEVHACRKFPSYIGNIHMQTLDEIYDSETARRYRSGSKACQPCPIRPVCGGCLAVGHGQGLDVFSERDPHCFLQVASTSL